MIQIRCFTHDPSIGSSLASYGGNPGPAVKSKRSSCSSRSANEQRQPISIQKIQPSLVAGIFCVTPNASHGPDILRCADTQF